MFQYSHLIDMLGVIPELREQVQGTNCGDHFGGNTQHRGGEEQEIKWVDEH
ncbi:hypothetical protein D3C83_290950 [compost metagenome]